MKSQSNPRLMFVFKQPLSPSGYCARITEEIWDFKTNRWKPLEWNVDLDAYLTKKEANYERR